MNANNESVMPGIEKATLSIPPGLSVASSPPRSKIALYILFMRRSSRQGANRLQASRIVFHDSRSCEHACHTCEHLERGTHARVRVDALGDRRITRPTLHAYISQLSSSWTELRFRAICSVSFARIVEQLSRSWNRKFRFISF